MADLHITTKAAKPTKPRSPRKKLPRYGYHDTPKGMMRTDRKTGKRKFIRIKGL